MNVAAEFGFFFHHASPEGYVQMVLWTDPSCECRLPAYAHHYSGVGGCVLNEQGTEVLLIQKRRNTEDKWQFPGGFVDKGEALCDAVEREVHEETGIDADFCSVVGFRETVNFKYGAQDLYFVCALIAKDKKEVLANGDEQLSPGKIDV